MTAAKPPSATPAPVPRVDPYHEHDPIPQPDVRERSSETAWALWSDVKDKEDERYAPTVQVTPGAIEPPKAAPAAPAGGLDKLVEECRRNNRVCPRPGHWQRLDALLRARVPGAAAALPSPPRGLDEMSALGQRSAFRPVIDWAAENGVTEDMLQFVRALPEAQWHHLGG